MFVTAAYAQSTPTVGETHSETAVAPGAAHESTVFPPFDHTTFPSQILWLVITFALFYVLMQKVIVPRVGSILDDRHDRIARDLDDAAKLKAEADAAIETYEKELAVARSQASRIGSAAREDAKTKAAADRAAIEAEMSAKIEAAQVKINAIKAAAFQEVGTIAADTAETLVEALVPTKVSKDEIQAAVTAASVKQEA